MCIRLLIYQYPDQLGVAAGARRGKGSVFSDQNSGFSVQFSVRSSQGLLVVPES